MKKALFVEMVITFPAGLSPSSFEMFLSDSSNTQPHVMLPHLNIRWLFEARLQPRSAISLTDTLHNSFTSYMLGYLISKSSFCWNLSMNGDKDVIHFFVRGILSSGNKTSEGAIALSVEMNQPQTILADLSCALITVDPLVVFEMSQQSHDGRLLIGTDGGDQQSDIGLFFSNLANGDPLIIKHLYLQSVHLHDTYMNGFKSYLENTIVLRRLTLEECSIKSADGEVLLSQGLQACKCLEMLDIYFDSPRFPMLNINGNTSIKVLGVDVCSYQQLYWLFTAVCGNNTIEELIVKGTHFRHTGYELGNAELQEVLNKTSNRSTGLKSITLSIHLSSVICSVLSENCTLQKLTIDASTTRSFEGMTNMLRLNKSLNSWAHDQ
jgi:hypothetical protein